MLEMSSADVDPVHVQAMLEDKKLKKALSTRRMLRSPKQSTEDEWQIQVLGRSRMRPRRPRSEGANMLQLRF